MKNYRHTLIVSTTFIAGLYFFLEYLLPEEVGGVRINRYHDQISNGVIIVGTMAIGLGIINILRVHGAAILKSRRGWINSLALVLSLFVMLWFEGNNFIDSEQSVESWKQFSTFQSFSRKVKDEFTANGTDALPRLKALGVTLDRIDKQSRRGEGFLALTEPAPIGDSPDARFVVVLSQAQRSNESLLTAYAGRSGITELTALHEQLEGQLREAMLLAQGLAKRNYDLGQAKYAATILENGFFFPLGSAMFSLLAFYIATAAYRSFRIRSLESMVMMLAALLVMLGQIPHGPLYISKHLPAIRLWLLEYLSTPAFRAIYFGSAVAGLAMATRMWLSLERSPLSSEEQEG